MPADNGANIFDIFTEPESAANTDYQPVYPYNNVTQTNSGHSFELDDTVGRERIRLQHRSGTFLEMHPNGSQVQKILGNGYYIVANDSNILVGVDDGNLAQKLNIVVYGDTHLNVKGDLIERIDGNYECHVKGDYSLMVEGDADILACQDMLIGANPDPFDPIGLSGTLTLSTGDHIYIDGDLQVEGVMSADSIHTDGHVTGLGIWAGLHGFVSETGGLAIGLPIAVPGQALVAGDIFVTPGLGGGTINAVTSFNTPGTVNCTVLNASLGNIGVMNATLMTDIVNTSIYNSHAHGNNGASPPSNLMVG
jgi:hypothetical protein